MDGLEHLLHEFRTHAAEGSLCATLVQDFVVASCLKDGHVVLFLERTDFAAHTHPLGQYLDDLVVAFVDL